MTVFFLVYFFATLDGSFFSITRKLKTGIEIGVLARPTRHSPLNNFSVLAKKLIVRRWPIDNIPMSTKSVANYRVSNYRHIKPTTLVCEGAVFHHVGSTLVCAVFHHVGVVLSRIHLLIYWRWFKRAFDDIKKFVP